MNKTLFSVGTLIAGCFALTSCSGGGDSDSDVNVGVLSGRTLCLQAPKSAVGAMYVRVGDRIGGGVCHATYSFGSRGGAQSQGTVTIERSVKGEKGWEACDFRFHLNQSDISQEVEFKGFFGAYLDLSGSSSSSGEEEDGTEGENNTESSGSIDADAYLLNVPEVMVKMRFDENASNVGKYVMEPTVVYVNGEEEPELTWVIEGDFYFEH